MEISKLTPAEEFESACKRNVYSYEDVLHASQKAVPNMEYIRGSTKTCTRAAQKAVSLALLEESQNSSRMNEAAGKCLLRASYCMDIAARLTKKH